MERFHTVWVVEFGGRTPRDDRAFCIDWMASLIEVSVWLPVVVLSALLFKKYRSDKISIFDASAIFTIQSNIGGRCHVPIIIWHRNTRRIISGVGWLLQ
jgi:hypothetical protein